MAGLGIRALLPRARAPGQVINLGGPDRLLRAALGVALLLMVAFGPATAWGLCGLPLLMSAAAASCPLYRYLGVSSCRAPRELGP